MNRNRERDVATDEALAAEGWTVLRFWEHVSPVEVAEVISATVRAVSARSRSENDVG